MLDFIYKKIFHLRKIQYENICFQRDSNPSHATPRQESQRFRLLGHAGLILSAVFIVQYSDLWIQMDMWQYLNGIGYGLIPNAKFCKQLLY